MITVKNFCYSGRVEDFTFNFFPKRCYMLLGVNGAGKSTLLNALAGQLPKRRYDGSIVLNKHYISVLSSKVRAQYIAMLSQKTSVMFNYKVKDIIRMGGYCHGKKSKQQAHLLSDIAEALELVKYIDNNYHQLSLGQQQRVQLARVIFQLLANQDPLAERWLLLDEHVANLDIYYQLQSFKLIKQLIAENHIGVIAAVHDVNLAGQFGDRLILLDKGRMIKSGTAKTVLLSEEFKQSFQIGVNYIDHQGVYVPQLSH